MRTSLCVLCVSWSKMSRDDMSPGDPPPHQTVGGSEDSHNYYCHRL